MEEQQIGWIAAIIIGGIAGWLAAVLRLNTSSYFGAIEVDGRQPVPGRKLNDQVAVNDRRRVRCNNQAAIRRVREGRDRALDLGGVAQIEWICLDPKRRGHGLDHAEQGHSGGSSGVAQDRHSRHAGRDLFEECQPFPAGAVFERGKAGGVAAGSRQTGNKSSPDGISYNREHNRYGAGHLEQRPYR